MKGHGRFFQTFLYAFQATSRNLSPAVIFKTLASDNDQKAAGGQEEKFMRPARQTKTWKQVLLINRCPTSNKENSCKVTIRKQFLR